MRKTFMLIITLFLLAASILLYADKIVFIKYPDFKLGFTTTIFTKSGYGPSLENEIKFIDYASDKGYAWIEIRDANGILTVNECKAIAAYAKEKNLEIAYATNRGPLDGDFWQVLGNAWRNGSVFTKGPRSVRTVDGGNTEFVNGKAAWTDTDFKKAIEIQTNALAGIKDQGLTLMAENANLPVIGPNGMEAFFDAIDPSFGFQFDTANMFAISKVRTDPKDAERVIRKLAPKIVYTHLKSSVNATQMPTLVDNELDFAVIFEILAKNKKNYIAIEIAQVETYEEQLANLEKSVDYLVKKGFVSIK